MGSPTCPTCGLTMERFSLGYNIEAWRCLAKDKTFHAYDAPTPPAPADDATTTPPQGAVCLDCGGPAWRTHSPAGYSAPYCAHKRWRVPTPADGASGAEAWAGGAILAILGVYRDEMPHDAVAALQTLADRLGHPLAPLPARDDAVEEARDAERFRWLMSRNFGFAFDAEKCGISTGRWGKWPEEADAQRAMIDRAIAHYAALRRAKGGA